ncbi:hypothetical protein GO988_14290 [Hymenobacter sp. HMF4947]|uniref:Uncharacterized protein n=1 Tax=Hymenobacter ginkgonis TaxID=2682976 RepID=A0A7K1TH46_9BACT|nr:hypothetical protein [Hymenobacter ginkgonis]MVN77501.1 hypothetical protein [Hymenobacter ginkgonis]
MAGRACVGGIAIAFVLIRPFGAAFGTLLTKPVAKNGLGFGTQGLSLILLCLVVGARYPLIYAALRLLPTELTSVKAPT